MSHISKTFTLHVILIPIFSNRVGTPKFRKEFHTIVNSPRPSHSMHPFHIDSDCYKHA